MKRLVILCNAIDDVTRHRRSIDSDSPAATNKVLGLARALRGEGVRPLVLSLGRGRQNGSGKWHGWAVGRSDGAAMLYAPFLHRAVATHLVSLIFPALVIGRLRRRADENTLVFYNRVPSYLLTVVAARLMGWRVVLDLEDAPTHVGGGSARAKFLRLLDRLLDRCAGRALLASGALATATSARRHLPYYGSIRRTVPPRPMASDPVRLLLGGTLEPATGSDLLIAALERIRQDRPPWGDALEFHVTGRGAGLARLREAADDRRSPRLVCHGAVSRAEYLRVLAGADVGLSLKLRDGPYANTTFPSKVIEYAQQGKLVVATDVSDVRAVLGAGGAFFLANDDPAALVDVLRRIATDRALAEAVAAAGTKGVMQTCLVSEVAPRLERFLFPTAAD